MGGGFCDLPPTGRPVFMRVMDFYFHHEERIRENWVPLDMLGLLRQTGVDMVAQMRDMATDRAPAHHAPCIMPFSISRAVMTVFRHP